MSGAGGCGHANHVLAEFYGFDLSKQPLWIDSCIVPELHVNLIDGSLRPARGNILLVGDAAGLMDTLEGGSIGLAVHTGALAADCVVRGEQEGDKAYTAVKNALDYMLYYDIGLRNDKEKLYQKLDGKTPKEIIVMGRR